MLLKLLRRILLFSSLLIFALSARAQLPFEAPSKSNLRIKKLAVSADSLRLDTLSIIPNSFLIRDISDTSYRLDYVKSVIYWKTKPSVDSVLISYRVFPFRLNSYVQRWNYDSIVNNVYVKTYDMNQSSNAASRGLLDFGNITANGSLGRELSFGNSQDAVVNSNFQLQLNGMLKDSIELSAAFTDNNLPIQPDGTTQQLNEFDRVFLQFKKKGLATESG